MIQVPFIFQRINPHKKQEKTKADVKRCYFCEKKIKEDKGYYEFHRKYDEYPDPKYLACHRTDCKLKFMRNQYDYGYKNIYKHSAAYYF